MAEAIGLEAEKLSTLNDPVAWIEKYFRIPETMKDPNLKKRGKLVLAQYQKDLLREIYSRDENGHLKYSTVIWSDIKKSIKSTIAAASNLYFCNMVDWGEFFVVANDLKQADGRVSYYARRSIELNPELQKMFKIVRNKNKIENKLSGSYIESVPIDPSGEAGSNANLITFSELWGANEIAKQRMFSEMTIPPNKHGLGMRWIESYAGFMGESELLYSLYEAGVKQGELLWPDRLYEVTEGQPTVLEAYVNKEARMLCLWNTQPRMPWQIEEYYKSERALLMPSEFDRMHRNQWTTSVENYVPIEWWDACKRDTWPTINTERESMVIALDAAVSGDSFGLWMGCRHPENRDEVCVVYSQEWTPPKGGKLDFIGTEEQPGPELVLRKLISRYNVVKVTYDEYQLHSMCTRLYKEGLAWFSDFDQGPERMIADTQLRVLIRDRRIWHRGEPELRQHIMNSDAKVDPEEHKMRIVKRTQKLKVDLNVAQSMGTRELLRLNL